MNDSRELVVEADVTDLEAIEKAGPAMAYKPPDTLKNHVPPADYARFLKLLPRYRMPESAVAQMKPLMASSLLVFAEWARQGYLPDYGVDVYLIKKARAELKPMVELEGTEAQMKLMDSLSEAESRTLFAGTLGALESGLTGEQIEGMVHAWQVGDPQLAPRRLAPLQRQGARRGTVRGTVRVVAPRRDGGEDLGLARQFARPPLHRGRRAAPRGAARAGGDAAQERLCRAPGLRGSGARGEKG